jgi:hypothetical protein
MCSEPDGSTRRGSKYARHYKAWLGCYRNRLAEVGIAKARKRAAELGHKLNAPVQNADEFDFGIEQWDLMSVFYFSGYIYVHDFEKRIGSAQFHAFSNAEAQGRIRNYCFGSVEF